MGIPSIGKDSIGKDSIGKDNRGRFAPPSLQEVADYCKERKNKVDPQTFVDFYEAKGWKIGKETMKDWKAAVRTWERREEKPQVKRNRVVNGYEQRSASEIDTTGMEVNFEEEI